MKRNEYTILKRTIQSGSLVSLNSHYWYNNNGSLYPWVTGSLNIGPETGSGIYNFTSSIDGKYSSSIAEGYYRWNGNTWVATSITGISESYNLPIFLEADADEMGVMSSFDGNMEQIEQIVNFSYKQSGSTVTIYSTVNPDKLRKIIEQKFTVDWGDGTTGELDINHGVLYSNLPSLTHPYSGSSKYTISITLKSPWTTQKVQKIVTVPQDFAKPNPMGTFTGMTIPAYSNLTGQTQNHLNNLDYTNNTGNTIFKYMAFGGSKIGELRKYGQTTLSTSSYTTGTYSGSLYSGYTLPSESGSLYYMDFADGYTMITGTTSAFTKEEVYNKVITRNEHFIGFIDDPTVYSDIFVERGRQGIMEPNLRLGEIDNMDELEIYGNGYFKVKKQ